jgi:two-component system cell cycle sensor histidine kinase/response regulator CckA
VLKYCGYKVYEFDDPNTALRERTKLKFDLVLTDVVMPGISGPELVKEIHASNPEIPCIFMSGFDAHEVAGRGVTDVCSYLRKPFTPESLVRRVRNTLEGHSHD